MKKPFSYGSFSRVILSLFISEPARRQKAQFRNISDHKGMRALLSFNKTGSLSYLAGNLSNTSFPKPINHFH